MVDDVVMAPDDFFNGLLVIRRHVHVLAPRPCHPKHFFGQAAEALKR